MAYFRYLAILCACLGAALAVPVSAQRANYIEADLVAEEAPVAGETLTVALRFRPQEGWHGYWANPGDAGEGMRLDWQLPEGWEAGEPLYPVPRELELLGLINHVYKDPYAVLVPLEVPASAAVSVNPEVSVDAQWLACSDRLCVPERATLTLRYPQQTPELAAQFDAHRAAIPPLLDSEASLAIAGDTLRLAIPLPASLDLADPHVFLEQKDVIDYAAPQAFYRDGNMLVAEIARGGLRNEPGELNGILAFADEGEGVRFSAAPGEVPTGGTRIGGQSSETPLALLLGGALLGGLLLNLMPCVFPILSLKALTLARAGGEERQARIEGLAYTAGVVLACLALGALLLVLRAGGAQIGWAFQLQEPLVVAALLVVATLITANFAGLFEIPSLPIRTRGEGGAFMTGLLAAVVATPCTGPFMAAALGAALLLPAPQALLLFAMLGLGLALPFLLLGFVPALRRMLPKPGAWMETFRRILAIPMGLTALALAWLAIRLGGMSFAFAALALSILPVVALAARRNANRVVAGIALVAALYFAGSLPFRVEEQVARSESVLEPQAYSQEALAEARASGVPVFLWFTADWCLTCKVNEQVAIEREATREAFEEAGVIAMRGDWTRRDPAITRYLEEWQVAGVPLYVWYPAGSEGEQLPQVLTPDALVELAESAD
ncbi:protein-disulfide reductase DsbD family protein [Aurantiacibacter poecillastricola]|uniref:protein-disulfide reductase DsbD family protein n=1 Tax=Aurantiacibacter poecillastricola TaxID=3064385 RepID=UPI00273EAD6A|nr:protein-disulfide reductase DsbD domain-containing protein [Aurantiacibacter sp. 219JJ12-13]MDP5261438.1 protein-disulfide reductase DsbD family protein [Aurantiacibacter sp. 219JJ12-13]